MIYKKGDFIGEKFEVFDVLGEGGFGIVYLVYSHGAKAVYALKTFRDEYLEDAHIRERFRKEAQVWIDLESHPYIVRAWFVDEFSGRLYIAMAHIAPDEQGLNTLEGYLRRKPPDLAQSLRWAIQFCHGMEHAYSKGINAHRDIKPSNIMIDQNKNIKISDFGLAGVLLESSVSEKGRTKGKDSSNSVMQTAIGTSIGTPEYMPPEQFENLSACDERSDIYSFGIVLYQMLAGGSLPFSTDNPDLRWMALKHFHRETPVPKLNSPLFPIIFRCLEKKPINRYFSCKELRRDLELLLKNQTGEIVKLPEFKELEEWEFVLKGFSLSNLGKHKDAIACYDKYLKINPKDERAWTIKGNTLKHLDKYQEAINCYDKALEINSRNNWAWKSKINVLRTLGKYQEAINCYDRALEIDPRNDWAWKCKGNELKEIGKYHEAIACYDRALEINPGDDRAWYSKGRALDELDKYQDAIVCYDRALQLNPSDTDVWNIKGDALEHLDKFQEAINCYDKALEIDPGDAYTWLSKAIAEDELGLVTKAILSYRRYIAITPAEYQEQIENVRQRLSELEGR